MQLDCRASENRRLGQQYSGDRQSFSGRRRVLPAGDSPVKRMSPYQCFVTLQAPIPVLQPTALRRLALQTRRAPDTTILPVTLYYGPQCKGPRAVATAHDARTTQQRTNNSALAAAEGSNSTSKRYHCRLVQEVPRPGLLARGAQRRGGQSPGLL
jgi:hypothetical protein